MRSKFLTTLAIKRWLQRKKQHYKIATNDYVEKLRDALRSSNKSELKSLNEAAITLLIGHSLASTKLEGVTIKRSDLPNVEVDERVRLITEDGKIIGGRVLFVSKLGVKIKFDKAFSLLPVSEGDNDRKTDNINSACEPPVTEAPEEHDEIKTENKETLAVVNDEEDHILKREHHVVLKIKPDSVDMKNAQVTKALKRFRKVKCSIPIHKYLLGNYKDRTNVKFNRARIMPIKGLIQPKGNQALAIEQSMMKRICLVEGVAGGGKSLVAAHIACSMSRLKKRKVLICSPIQATLDKLAQMINSTGTYVVQLPQQIAIDTMRNDSFNSTIRRRYRNCNNRTSNHCLLDARVDTAIFNMSLRRLALDTPSDNVGYRRAWRRKNAKKMVINCSSWRRQHMERLVLSQADVICCSPNQAGELSSKGLKFDVLIIDDAQFVSELECLVPIMSKGIKQVTLLSDIRREILLARSNSSQANSNRQSVSSSDIVANKKQTSLLPNGRLASPMMKLNRSRKRQARLESKLACQEPGSLFKRFLSMGQFSVLLKYQYRMQGALSVFPGFQFYFSRLRDDQSTNEELLRQINSEFFEDQNEERFNWIPKREEKLLTALFDTESIQETACDIVNKLIDKENIIESRIGVIVNSYSHITILNETHSAVKVGTVKDFFGQERDFIVILGTTNSNKCSDSTFSLDYLKNDIALKIALTRPRLGLFVVADLKNMVIEENSQSTASSSTDNNTSCSDKRETCCRSWRKLIEFYRYNKLVS